MALRADDVDLGRDRALVERFQAGEAAGFEDLYRRYYRRVFRYCLRRVGDAHEAEELTQEAFVRAYRAMPGLNGERRFFPWMTVIASRLCTDAYRRNARSQPVAEIDAGSVDEGHDAVFAAVETEQLAGALNRLGPRHRDVLALREEEGWSYQRIADHYGVSVDAVTQLLWRARKALRREFLAVAGGDGRRLAGLPILGWVLRRTGGWWTRLSGWSAGPGGPLAGNALAVAIVVTTAVVVGGGPSTPPVDPGSRPAVLGHSDARLASVSVDRLTDFADVASPAATAVAAPRPGSPSGPPGGSTTRVGSVTISSAEEGRQRSAGAPISVDGAGVRVAVQPDAAMDEAAEYLEVQP